ncbi:MAG: 50S ribosomal protein L11 methyltransferase [Bacillaceae bacterium]|nr:50S ribosomal protein L11 methyltransferase [Bacillaceae bacterium]
MRWSEISIHTSQEAIEAVANILHEAGASGVVIEDPEVLYRDWEGKFGEVYELSPGDFPEEGVIVKAYLPINSCLQETVEEIKDAVNNLFLYGIDRGTGQVTLTEVREEEWATAWKKYYKPVHISDRFTITPTWENYETPPDREGEMVIELDPGMAFGTGTHPTTVLAIRALEKTVKPGDRVIDVGTGSGVLSVAAAKLGASRILALDLDDVAVSASRINFKLNRIDAIAESRQNNLLDGVDMEADIVVANILAEVILRFVDDVGRVLTPSGYFIASGIIKNKEAEVKDSARNAGLEILETFNMEDWVAFIAKKV